MSRHRDCRNLENDYADDDDDDYYNSSYSNSMENSAPLSSSMERYMYRPGHTPKMSQFVGPGGGSSEADDDDHGGGGAMRPRSDSETSSSGSINYEESLNSRDRDKLAKCMEDILDIVGDTMQEQTIKEAIIRCDFDKEVALNTLLNNPVSHRGERKSQRSEATTTSGAIPKHTTLIPSASSPSLAIPITGAASRTPYQQPKAQKPKTKPKIIEINSPPQSSSGNVNNNVTLVTAASSSNLEAMRKAAAESNVSPVVTRKQLQQSTPGSSSKPVPMRKAKIDGLRRYQEDRGDAGDAKELLNLVVVGHVDSGKSTLMGHLLYKLGAVNQKQMHKYEQESRKLGKQSFAYAWVLDETSEERERGITMDVGQSRFETGRRRVTLLDAPGHKDFIPRMISGASQADVAVLVVNAARGEFEAGFDAGGQTREHALLVRSLGVSQLAVAVNKMDAINWDQGRFQDIKTKLRAFLKTVGFKDSDVKYVPVSGYTGDNLIKAGEGKTTWFEGGTLLDAIDGFRPPARLVERPFRMSVSDVFKPVQSSSTGVVIAGRVESGFVMRDDRVLLAPSAEVATVKAVLIEAGGGCDAFAGDHVQLTLTGVEPSAVSAGMVACDPSQPIPITRRFRARVVVFAGAPPVTKGMPAVLHYGPSQAGATIKKLVAEVDKATGEVTKKKPRCIGGGCNAIIEIATETPICLEAYANVKELGRLTLRCAGKTVAAGVVTEIL